MPDITLSTLEQIRTKVRRLTRSPSTAQLSESDIDSYVNNFVLYDFPETLRLFDLRTTLSFYTSPYIDVYEENTINVDDPLYNFKNKYTTIHPPLYVAGYQMLFSQSREQFYNSYPMLNNMELIATGDGVTNTYNGTLSAKPITPGSVSFTSISTINTQVVLKDVQDIDPVSGTRLPTGTLETPNVSGFPSGTINYVTGVYSLTFPAAPDCPGLAQPIYCQDTPYVAARPMSILYFQDKFIVRPVPDMPYKIELEAYLRPSELLTTGSMPELSQWWQYIAYGAAKKVFEDRMDMDSITMIMPELKHQERLINRKTIVQQSNERTATIFTEQGNSGTGGAFGGGLF